MPRARNIKPSIFKNEILGESDPILSLLFMGLWCLADREGRLENRPKRIKAEIFPYRDDADVNRYLTELERLGFIHTYSANNFDVIEVCNFKKHQHPHHTEKASELPEKPIKSDGCPLTVKQPLEDGEVTDTLRLIPDSSNTDSLTTSNGRYPPEFDEFWLLYPRKVGKGDALKAWEKLKPSARLQDKMKSAVLRQIESRDWKRDGGKFIPHPATWINQSRWDDELPPANGQAEAPSW